MKITNEKYEKIVRACHAYAEKAIPTNHYEKYVNMDFFKPEIQKFLKKIEEEFQNFLDKNEFDFQMPSEEIGEYYYLSDILKFENFISLKNEKIKAHNAALDAQRFEDTYQLENEIYRDSIGKIRKGTEKDYMDFISILEEKD